MKKNNVKYIVISSLVVGLVLLVYVLRLLFGVIPSINRIASAEITNTYRKESIIINADEAKMLIKDLKKKRFITPTILTHLHIKTVFYDKSGNIIFTLTSLDDYQKNGDNYNYPEKPQVGFSRHRYVVDKSFYDDLKLIAKHYNFNLGF